MLKYINENNVILKYVNIEDLEVNDIEKAFYQKYYLPMYFNVHRKYGEILGFCINGFPCDKFKDGKYKKEYRLLVQILCKKKIIKKKIKVASLLNISSLMPLNYFFLEAKQQS